MSVSARTQPTRRPPQTSLDSEPTVMIGASGAKAASGAGTSPVIGSSAIVSSSISRQALVAARAARWPRGGGSGTTVPSGLWCVGTM